MARSRREPDDLFGLDDYTTYATRALDEHGVSMVMHTSDDEGFCLWCKTTYPCERVRASDTRRSTSPDN